MLIIRIVVLACVVALSVACDSRQLPIETPNAANLDPPIILEGTVYTPISVGAQGCVLYNLRVPGGQAPAALVYRNATGEFSYEPPDHCVKATNAP